MALILTACQRHPPYVNYGQAIAPDVTIAYIRVVTLEEMGCPRQALEELAKIERQGYALKDKRQQLEALAQKSQKNKRCEAS